MLRRWFILLVCPWLACCVGDIGFGGGGASFAPNQAQDLGVTPQVLPHAMVGKTYSAQYQGSGGLPNEGAYAFAACPDLLTVVPFCESFPHAVDPASEGYPRGGEDGQSGLPPGLTLSDAGVWSGAPLQAGTYTFSLWIYEPFCVDDLALAQVRPGTCAAKLNQTLVVDPAASLVSITVVPATADLSATGIPYPQTTQFHAVGKWSDGSQTDLTQLVTWESDNPLVVDVRTGSGIATAYGSGGPVTITASCTGIACAASATPGTAQVNAISQPSSPGFKLTASPTWVSALQDYSAASTITASSVNGFNGTVTFDVARITGLPSGVTASFDSSSVSVPGSTTLKFRAAADAASTIVPSYVLVPATSASSGTSAYAVIELTVGNSARVAAQETLASSANPAEPNQAVTFTASVAAPAAGSVALTPTGRVQFAVDGVNLGAAVMLAADGTATSTSTSFSTAGNHTITAAYDGDVTYLPETAPPLIQLVGARPTAIAITPLMARAVPGDAVLYTATVTDTSTGPATPGGVVTLADVTAPSAPSTIGSCNLSQGANAAGIASCPMLIVAPAPPGTHTLAARYAPTDNIHSASQTATPAVLVTSQTPALRLTTTTITPMDTTGSVGVASATPGGATAFKVTVTDIDTGTPSSPAGSIALTDSSTPGNTDGGLDSCSLRGGGANPPGTVSCVVTVSITLPYGLHTIDAAFTAGDGIHGSSISATPEVVHVAGILAGISENFAATAFGNGFSEYPYAVSQTGRYVVFESQATDLLSTPLVGTSKRMFVRDTCIGAQGCTPATALLSVDDSGQPIVSPSELSPLGNDGETANISGDGSIAVFDTSYGPSGLYTREFCGVGAGACPASTVAAAYDTANNPTSAIRGVLSRTGRFIAYRVFSPQAIYVHDTCRGATGVCTPSTQQVNIDNFGSTSTEPDVPLAVSADGRYVLFEDEGGTMPGGVPGNSGPFQLYVRDMLSARSNVYLVSCDNNDCGPAPAGWDRLGASMSDDGRFVAFSTTSALVPNDQNRNGDVYVRDTCLGPDLNATQGCVPTTYLVSVGANGAASGGTTTRFAMDASGRFIAFAGGAGAPGYVRDTCLAASPLATPCTPTTAVVTWDGAGRVMTPQEVAPALSADGHYVIWETLGAIPGLPGAANLQIVIGATGY
jgi:hypothetical protein